jgi:hypothetical protein
MCCLKYEQEHYENTRKKMPKIGRELMTPDGIGVITAINVLSETVTVRLPVGDSFENRVYAIDDCQRTDGGRTQAPKANKDGEPEEKAEMLPAEENEPETGAEPQSGEEPETEPEAAETEENAPEAVLRKSPESPAMPAMEPFHIHPLVPLLMYMPTTAPLSCSSDFPYLYCLPSISVMIARLFSSLTGMLRHFMMTVMAPSVPNPLVTAGLALATVIVTPAWSLKSPIWTYELLSSTLFPLRFNV